MTSDIGLPTLVFTGGHHTGALALAQRLMSQGWKIIWFGHRYSQWGDKSDSAEYREVTSAGIEFYDLKAGKLYHTLHPLKLIRLPWGFIQAFILLLKLRIRLKSDLKGIVSFGGYLGVPVVTCGWLLSIPGISHEQTLSAGWANKAISLFAKKIAVSWPSSLMFYPARKTILTGLPFRKEIMQVFNQKPEVQDDLLYITGGKQGSHIINQVVFDILPKILIHFRVIHQTGNSTVFSDFQKAKEIKKSLPEKLGKRYQVFDYLPAGSVAKYLSTAGIVISRAGAHIIQELLLFRVKSVLIPISWSSHNEQLKNAQFLAGKQLGVILPENNLSGQSLLSAISQAASLKPVTFPVITDGLEKLNDLVKQQFSKS